MCFVIFVLVFFREKEDDLEQRFDLLNRELRAMMTIEGAYKMPAQVVQLLATFYGIIYKLPCERTTYFL